MGSSGDSESILAKREAESLDDIKAMDASSGVENAVLASAEAKQALLKSTRAMPLYSHDRHPWGVSASHLLAHHTRQSNLEAMQWVAFAAMVIDHLALFGPALWGSEPTWMHAIGRVAYPIFAAVFAWRLAFMTWRDSSHDFTGMAFRLSICALAAQLAWEMSGLDVPVNVVAGFLIFLGIVLLLQEDRLGFVQQLPIGIRWSIAALMGYWVERHVDFGMAGLTMTLAAYAHLRFADEDAKVVGGVCLAILTLTHPVHAAFFALPLAWVIFNQGWSIKRSVPSVFYWLYPAHVVGLIIVTLIVHKNTGAALVR